MKVFVDASALIAIIADESDARELVDRLQAADDRLCSAIAIWETIAGISRSYGLPPAGSRMRVNKFLDVGEFRIVPIGDMEARSATEAYIKFGKGRHRASLNMGDCFAYACAKTNGAKLLYKGDDFVHTDLA